MAYTEEMTTSEILLRLASMRNELLQAVNDIEKISKNICYKAEQTEPTVDKDINVRSKDEPQKKDVEWVYNKRERLWYPYSNGELLFKTEPQTCEDCIWNVCNYNKAFEDEPQTDSIGCSKCASRYDCIDRDLPHAIRCNNYGKDTEQTDCPWK